jgi:hypothetical protein
MPRRKGAFGPIGKPARAKLVSVPLSALKRPPPPPGNNGPLRRSTRAQVPPLQFWKGERVEYGPNPDRYGDDVPFPVSVAVLYTEPLEPALEESTPVVDEAVTDGISRKRQATSHASQEPGVLGGPASATSSIATARATTQPFHCDYFWKMDNGYFSCSLCGKEYEPTTRSSTQANHLMLEHPDEVPENEWEFATIPRWHHVHFLQMDNGSYHCKHCPKVYKPTIGSGIRRWHLMRNHCHLNPAHEGVSPRQLDHFQIEVNTTLEQVLEVPTPIMDNHCHLNPAHEGVSPQIEVHTTSEQVLEVPTPIMDEAVMDDISHEEQATSIAPPEPALLGPRSTLPSDSQPSAWEELVTELGTSFELVMDELMTVTDEVVTSHASKESAEYASKLWEARFMELLAYRKINGSCVVPSKVWQVFRSISDFPQLTPLLYSPFVWFVCWLYGKFILIEIARFIGKVGRHAAPSKQKRKIERM